MASTVFMVSTGFCSKTALVPVVAAMVYCADKQALQLLTESAACLQCLNLVQICSFVHPY